LERIAPKEYTDVLKQLQDSGPSLPFDEIRVALDHDLANHGRLEDIYPEFEKNAIAAASLAQVHKAKLKVKFWVLLDNGIGWD
jgi:predicted unusual protein kinase regulating ubiquinone biosynthesis (AarF/ABC1/UbiB family)